MLVVEIDSIYHAGKQKQDHKRDAELTERGYFVMRIFAGDVAKTMDGVLSTIRRVAEERIEAMEKNEDL